MNKYDKIKDLDPPTFKRITGVTKEVFAEILTVLLVSYAATHKRGGRKGLPVELRLTIALEYWREYRTMAHMAIDYGIPVSTLCDCITWCEDILSQSEEFKIQGIKERYKENSDNVPEALVIDVEEQPIERPKNNQKDSYSGKKKRHTRKYQIVIDKATYEILDIYDDLGAVHDFTMFKDSLADFLPECTFIFVDKGYQGIGKMFPNAMIPTKATKNHPLTVEEVYENKELARERIVIEHINRELKIFRICKETYRNKGRRGLLRVKLVASFYNHRLRSQKPPKPTAPSMQVNFILLYTVVGAGVSE